MGSLRKRLEHLERHSSSRSEEATLREFLEVSRTKSSSAWRPPWVGGGCVAGRGGRALRPRLEGDAQPGKPSMKSGCGQARRNPERRDRELVTHNRALAGLPPLENDE